ncbi:hypothetical protein [Burkholderia ubonensis]|uniref:hypothetical protein n=1 Tax=Burkholderia ubonensis TaxID=101571 RepID=UPI00075E255A|nr:hypothetical protein [Burkholderia ubonensis]KVK98634.1 hypothetical protein WJ45_16475 [Burkholderia ubonensis]KVQ60313.1 hypothetical protein WK04_26135 [Burkholderia ubonensis]
MSLETAIEANTAAIKELTATLLATGALQTAQASAALQAAPGVQAVAAAQKAADEANRRANPAGGQHASAEEARAASQEQSRTAAALAAAKKREAAATDANAGAAATHESKPSGATSAPTPGKSSAAPELNELQPWAETCAETYASLKDGESSLDNIKTAILAINSKIDRAQANAVLGRFGAQAVTAKADKRGLDPEQYADFFVLCLDVLSGRVDATASLPTEA